MKNQQGFHLIIIPLIVVIVGIIGFAGWYVYDANKNTNEATDNSANATNPTPVPTSSSTPTATITPIPSATADWQDMTGVYGDQNYNFTYKVPSSWTASSYYPDIKPIIAATNFTKNYLLYVYDVTEQDIASFYNSFYVNGATKPAPTNLSILQINSTTAYKFYIPGHGAAETTDTGTANILFYRAPTSQKVFGKAVQFMFIGGSAEEALADETLNTIASTFSFN
jgi:cytoskeletal protein RodZ